MNVYKTWVVRRFEQNSGNGKIVGQYNNYSDAERRASFGNDLAKACNMPVSYRVGVTL